ncbi:MAG: phosphatidate cytidylyltransferase [Nitrospiraceae bacterium]|nr:phosphatidate cytidylyltransferase [Nitrospiraceae bacterium]
MRKLPSLAVRTGTALVVLPLLLVLIWSAPLRLGFALFIGVIAAVGLYEYYAIARHRQITPETIGGIAAGTLVALSGWFNDAGITAATLYGACLFVALLHVLRGQRAVEGLATTIFGVFYVGWLPAHILLLHGLPYGPSFVTLLLVAVALTDSAAYVVGSTVGRHKLAPNISPNKTWEGSIGGFVATLVGMAVLYRLSQTSAAIAPLSLWQYLCIGAILSVVGQIGDLAESCLKRSAGVKDSGMMFPGHGGVLDRCDGFLFAAPALYYVVHALNRWAY